MWLQIRHFHNNDVRNGSSLNSHNSPATYDTECFQDHCFNSDNTIIVWRRMLHHTTTLHFIDLKKNHSLMRMANYGYSLKWLCFGAGLIRLFFVGFSENQCHHQIRCLILHEIVFLSQSSQISTMVILYMSPSINLWMSTLYHSVSHLVKNTVAALCVSSFVAKCRPPKSYFLLGIRW